MTPGPAGPASSREPGLKRRFMSALGRHLASAFPGLYLRWSMRDLEGWTGAIPWTQTKKPLSDSRVALVSSGGLILPEQEPFDLSAPNGDCTFRVIPSDADTSTLRVSHMSYDPANVEHDPEVMLPLGALARLAAKHEIGSVSPRHISFSGSIPDPTPLVAHYAPEIASILRSDEVDLAMMAPA